MFEIKRYSPEDAAQWNQFVAGSKNGTFLLDRRYMDYHSDRFVDCSLMFFLHGRLYALLPANLRGDELWSHGGLTYGGLIMGTDIKADDTLQLFTELNKWLKAEGIKRVVYKAIPWIYQQIPAEEDLYAMWRTCRPKLLARDIASTIDMQRRIKWSRDRKYGINRARTYGISIERSTNFEGFWKVLDWNLMHTYGVEPVHTLEEMQLLHSRFPNNIVLYVARLNGEVIGGTVIYLTPRVAHAQYISANAEGKHLRVIDAIYNKVLNEDLADYPYFDFGKSTEELGHVLNSTLIYQKEGFGGRGVCYDWDEWTL